MADNDIINRARELLDEIGGLAARRTALATRVGDFRASKKGGDQDEIAGAEAELGMVQARLPIARQELARVQRDLMFLVRDRDVAAVALLEGAIAAATAHIRKCAANALAVPGQEDRLRSLAITLGDGKRPILREHDRAPDAAVELRQLATAVDRAVHDATPLAEAAA